MCQHIEIFAALAARFGEHEVRERSQAGRTFPYVTARTVMNRLDEVLGPMNWWDEYVPIDGAVICKLTIRLPEGDTLTKSDVGGYSKTQDESDTEKTGFSDAFKRAAVKFGVGRYLYGDGLPPVIVAELTRPNGADAPAAAQVPAPASAGERRDRRDDLPPRPAHLEKAIPRTGKDLFGWAKDRDLLGWFGELGKAWRFPARMVQWDEGHVAEAYREWQAKGPAPSPAPPKRAVG